MLPRLSSAVSAIKAGGCQSGVQATWTCTGRSPRAACIAWQRRIVLTGKPTSVNKAALKPACTAAYKWSSPSGKSARLSTMATTPQLSAIMPCTDCAACRAKSPGVSKSMERWFGAA